MDQEPLGIDGDPPPKPDPRPDHDPAPEPAHRATRDGRAPLQPGPPIAMLGWLRGRPGLRQARAIPIWVRAALTIVVTIALGTWGFRELAHTPRLSLAQSFYRAVRLYTLDLGPAAGGSGVEPNWQLWVALVLAAGLVARGVLALVRERMRRGATGHVLRGHVIVCGAGVHGTKFVQVMSDEHDVVLVDIAVDSLGMQASRGTYEWRLIGDCVREQTLLQAGAARAHWVVAVTGNDFVNSQIVSAMRGLAAKAHVRKGVQLLVQMEDPSLARFLEEETESETEVLVVSPFSANTIAAEALLEKSEVKLGNSGDLAPLLRMRGEQGREAPNLLLAGDHPLIDALILAALQRWRVRILRGLESGTPKRRPPLHVSVFGPDAVERVERLRARWLPESHVVTLEARDSGALGETQVELDDWLNKPDRADHAIVVCMEELDGIALTLGVSRALGDRVLMTRVTTQLESVLDVHLEDRTKRSPRLATTDVKSIAELACDSDAMGRLAGSERLGRALLAAINSGQLVPPNKTDHPAPTKTSTHAAPTEPGEPPALEVPTAAEVAKAMSTELFAQHALGLHSDAAWRILPLERALLEPLLEPVPLSAVVRAGLRVDLATPQNLRAAAEKLTVRGRSGEAFVAWCEYARHTIADSPSDVREWLKTPANSRAPDTLLRLRRATLGDARALDALEPDGEVLRGAGSVTIFAGAAGSMSPGAVAELERLLTRALIGYEGAILSGGTAVGVPGVVGRVAGAQKLRLLGYVPTGRADRELYENVRETPGAHDFSELEPLAMWTDILRAGIAVKDVRVVVCPGGAITIEEILIARALGARVGWLDPAGESSSVLHDTLPLGTDGVMELLADPMTIRAFINCSKPLEDPLREAVAQHLHNDYRRKHRARKAPGDPALAPWDDLLPALKTSNYAQADDIPNKLALVGKQVAKNGERLGLEPDQVELLAEVEHGRWNVERLTAGWQMGERHVGRSTTPDLIPWEALSEKTRDYDREAVRNIGPALAQAGWGVSKR